MSGRDWGSESIMEGFWPKPPSHARNLLYSKTMVGTLCGLAMILATKTPPPNLPCEPVGFLVPNSRSAAVGSRVQLEWRADFTDVSRKRPFPTGEVAWLFLRIAGTQSNWDAVTTKDPSQVELPVPLTEVGVALIGLDLRPREGWATGPQWASRLRTLGIELSVGDKVWIREHRSAAVLVRSLGSDPDPEASQAATAKTGLDAEIRALMDPTTLVPGSDLAFRVFDNGAAIPRAVVVATSERTGRTQTVSCDDSGIGHVRIEAGGVWRLEFQHARELPDRPGWKLIVGSLNFEVRS